MTSTTLAPAEHAPASRRLAGLPYEVLLSLAADLGLERGSPRAAASEQERWAAAGLPALTAVCDGARAPDLQGFNKADTNVGRYLGALLLVPCERCGGCGNHGGDSLTCTACGGAGKGALFDDLEWRGMVAICHKYHGQIGERPEATGHDLALDERIADAAGLLRARARKVSEVERSEPEVTIEHEQVGRYADCWVVVTPKLAPDAFSAALVDWRALPSRRWDGTRQANVVRYLEARALDALLRKHFAGKLALGPKGPFVIGAATK